MIARLVRHEVVKMIDWDREKVERFLDLPSHFKELSSPLGTWPTFTFDLPTPAGPIRFVVRPTLDECQFYSDDNLRGFVAAYVHTTKIFIDDEPEDEGGMCIVLVGKGGHACVSPGKPFYGLFFSMYGDKPHMPFDGAAN